MKSKCLIYTLMIVCSINITPFLLADNLNAPLLDVDISLSLQERGLLRIFAMVSNILSNKSDAEKLQEAFGPQTYENLKNSYELALIESFKKDATSDDSEIYEHLMVKLAPYLYRSKPSQRNEKFINKFIEYYSPGTATYEALEEWQKNTYNAIITAKTLYDIESNQSLD
jgi:hypothetical protein